MLLLAAALAEEPSDGVAAMDVAVREAPTFEEPEQTTWKNVPDAMSLEIALLRHDVPVANAVVLSAASYRASESEERVRISWLDMENGDARPLVDRRARRVCSPVLPRDMWPGGGVEIFEAPPARSALVMVERDPELGALVGLAPGDSMTVRDVRFDGKLVNESISIQRADGELTVRRTQERQRVCYQGG